MVQGMGAAVDRRLAAKKFARDWAGRGDEKQDTQTFWLTLLRDVFGATDAGFIQFEVPVKLEHTSFIDGLIPETHVLIEQKGMEIDLRKAYRQSDGEMLTPFEQARRYAGFLAHEKNPRWIVICNFREFHIHDMNRPNDPPEKLLLADLEKEYHRLNFLVDTGDAHIKKEMEISLQAGEIVGALYDALLKQYRDPSSEGALRSLNALCVRLVFCLYAEDAGIFGGHNMFHNYLEHRGAKGARKALIELFRVLDQKPEERDPYLAEDDPELAAFPYVNGGLFRDEDIEIPAITEEIYRLLLTRASEDFDWSAISPTIFGAVFESTLNPETRRKGGMHYTSIENIHKVIDPLFLDDLKAELAKIKALSVKRTREERLRAYQDKLARLKFLDPAAGSGNFLTESYLCLRALENEVIKQLYGDQIVMGLALNPIKVSITQFYGIEINDFAVSVARTALWIAESQMMRRTEDIVHMPLDFLPLKTQAKIVEGNALRMDWESVVPKHELSYIMGNPPFVGYSLQSKSQKEDILSVYVDEKGKPYKAAGKIDYVAGWYFTAAKFLAGGGGSRAAFVSTNSITQGEQVASVWKPLYERFGIHVDFAYRTFRWDSEASAKAQVHCVIVGFSCAPNENPRTLYSDGRIQHVENINAYLLNSRDIFIESQTTPLCDVPQMLSGNRPTDGGHLILSAEEKDELIKSEPEAKKYIKSFMMGYEFINNIPRFCLWLVGISPAELRRLPQIAKRVALCKAAREASPDAGRRRLAETPTLFREQLNPKHAIVIPKVSSERRRYIPLGYLDGKTIAGDKLFIIPDATIYHFGVLTSNVHMAWMRAICGRLKSDYSYSINIVYNNFPWPTPTDAQRAKIEQTALAILDARALYPDCSLADLYDESAMPYALRKAHKANDVAVMRAYGFPTHGEMDEPACVAALMEMYRRLTAGK